MTHALTLPDFSSRPADGDRVPFHADPILAAIERHEEAYAVLQVAPDGEASEAADAVTFDALHAMLATPCATRAGMLCLIRHLRWFLSEEAPNADAYSAEGGPSAWSIAQAREADLSRCLGVERIKRLPLALPSGRLIGPVIDLRPVSASTSTAEPYATATPTAVRFVRALDCAADVLAALVLIVGGCGFVGFASLL
ncbi:hypothetical protein [Methylorubrum sp. SB2]|uniref:hypothetical protein n=1 Tax=Methylorubrum subtropicum TaxID=3138812 RepID=UPI00313F1DB2